MSGTRLAAAWLAGIAVGSVVLVSIGSNLSGLAFPLFIGVGAFLLLQSRSAGQRFPGTELERGLERLFGLLIPGRRVTTSATALAGLQRHTIVAGLRRGARRWAKELQLISTDGYDTASRMSSLSVPAARRDDRLLVAEAVRVLRADRANAGADPMIASDPVAVLAYGIGARPAAADLTSLEELLDDLGLSEGRDDLRTHFDDVVAAETGRLSLQLKTPAERNMFRDLAGASFVLGASTRIIELASGRDSQSIRTEAGDPS